MLRFVAPAGSQIRVSQILRSSNPLISANGAEREWKNVIAASFGAHHLHGTSSGRAALWVILKAMHRLRPARSVVALPAYTCFTVPAAIARAGLRLHPVDIDPKTLDFDFAALEAVPGDELLCIVSASLFGFVNDFSRIGEIAHSKGAFVIDDAAQSLGSTRGGIPAGTRGDAGVYSFGRGKMLATIEGGLILTQSDEINRAIQALGDLPRASIFHRFRLTLSLMAYSIFLDPDFYWIPNSLPFLELGRTEFSPDFQVTAMPGVVHGLLSQLVPHLAANCQERFRRATWLREALGDNQRFTLPRPAPDCAPSYVRFPVLADEPGIRDRAVALLKGNGFGASPYYPSAVGGILGIKPLTAAGARPHPAAEDLSRRLFTLPTHSYVQKRDADQMIHILKNI